MEKVTLTPRELVLPEVGTLEADILGAYQERIKSYGEKARKTLDVLSGKKSDLKGSNCFAPIILRDLLPTGTRLATMADLGRATEINPRFLNGLYADTGLVLRTANDSYEPNAFLAGSLTRQFQDRGINLESPKVVYFDALELGETFDSDYGLVFNLSERAKVGENIFDAPELTEGFSFKTMDERGIPIKDEEGNRTLYVKRDGLSRFYLGGNSGVDSDGGVLAYSGVNGRVVVVSAEGTRADFNGYLANLKRVRDEQISQVQERYAKAEAILKGK